MIHALFKLADATLLVPDPDDVSFQPLLYTADQLNLNLNLNALRDAHFLIFFPSY